MVKPTKLEKSQHLLWSLLSGDQRIKHKMAYLNVLDNISNGRQESIISNIKINLGAPAALYLDPDLYGESAPNIVGKVLDESKGLVQFKSKDIIELLTLYYGNNILNT